MRRSDASTPSPVRSHPAVEISEDYKDDREGHGDDCEGVAKEIYTNYWQFRRAQLDTGATANSGGAKLAKIKGRFDEAKFNVRPDVRRLRDRKAFLEKQKKLNFAPKQKLETKLEVLNNKEIADNKELAKIDVELKRLRDLAFAPKSAGKPDANDDDATLAGGSRAAVRQLLRFYQQLARDNVYTPVMVLAAVTNKKLDTSVRPLSDEEALAHTYGARCTPIVATTNTHTHTQVHDVCAHRAVARTSYRRVVDGH